MLKVIIDPGISRFQVLRLFEGAGIRFDSFDSSSLVRSLNFPMELISSSLLPKIPAFAIYDWMSRFAIPDLHVVRHLNIDSGDIVLMVPSEAKYRGMEWFKDKVVATPYPDLLSAFFCEHSVRAKVMPFFFSGVSNEYPLADAYCMRTPFDGSILNMKTVETVSHSDCVIAAYGNFSASDQVIADDFLFRLDAALSARDKKLVNMFVPVGAADIVEKEIRSAYPFISRSDFSGQAKFEFVADESWFWDVIDHFKSLGASDIYISSISSYIP